MTSLPFKRRRARVCNTLEVSASSGLSYEARLQNEEDEGDDRNLIPTQREVEDGSKNFGDFPGKVPEGNVRLLFVNIYGIPPKADHPKNTQIREAIDKFGASIVGLAETNLCWKKIRGKDRWEERSRGWWENMRGITAHNVLESPKQFYQPGGTLMITRGSPTFRITQSGVDPSNMGRWCWKLYSGRSSVSTRVITAYRPCTSRGLTSTYVQQRRILDARKIDTCPRLKMMDELIAAIEEWLECGDQIILMMDLNDNVLNSVASNKLKAIGLNECISDRHSDEQPFATCNRGTRTIDGIFTSNTIMTQKGGYLPFNSFPSDHRAIWIEVTMGNLCGNNMAPIMNPKARRLKCNDPKTQKKWTNLYTTFLTERHVIQRAYQLQNEITKPMSEHHIIEYEKLRRIRQDGRKYADKNCRKLNMGGVPYSVELAQARKTIEMWKAIVSWKKGRKINMKYIKRLENQASSKNSRHCTLAEAKIATAKAFSDYWDIKRKSTELRKSFLQNKAKDLALTLNQEETNVYKQLITREQQRSSARKIKYVLQKVLGNGVSKISLLNNEGLWEETTNKKLIEQGCADENTNKYRQTQNTPMMQGQLVRDVGYLGNTEAAQAILDGTYMPPPGTNRYTTEFINELKYDPNAHNNPPLETLPTEDYIQGWKKKKEFTTSGKSGWTFSHSKTCALNKATANFEATMAHIPYVTGYTPLDWQIGVDIMIYKKINLDRVDKLRTIVLKEADANFNDGRLGKQMMDHAEKHNMIAREQYGSRKGHCSSDHAVNKRLSFDLIRLFRRPAALCSNDAKSCYDRILHSIAAIAMRRLGMPVPPIECMLISIQQMNHYIRTTHGDSETPYSSRHTLIPFQGVLQGNGAAPAIWVAVSTPLLNMMRTAQHGLQIVSAITKEKSKIVAFAFVDDTDLIQGNVGDTALTANEVMIEMQSAIFRWEGGLKATGGAIVPEKSFVYPIDFSFNSAGKVRYKTVTEIGTNFEVPNVDGDMVELRQLEPTHACETLGVFLAPDGNNAAAVEALQGKAQLWSDLVHKGHLTAADVMQAMDTTIAQTLKYSLPALTLTEKECQSIMAPVLKVALPYAHVSRNFPRSVVYGPKAMMGLGKSNIYVRQGVTHICTLQKFLNTDTITGELIRANIEGTKIHIGIGNNLFSMDYTRLNRLAPASLVKHIWYFCDKYNITIQEETTSDLIHRRQNDCYIMEEAASKEEFSNNDLEHINRCRIFLQVTTLSDITNGNGMLLRQGVMNGDMRVLHQPYYKWPRQSRPGIPSWRLWRKAMKTCFLHGVRLHLKRGKQLGPWNDGDQDDWNWFFSRRPQKIYERHLNRWKVYRRSGRGRIGGNSPFTYMCDAFSKPRDATRCTVHIDTQGRLRLSGTGRDVEEVRRTNKTPHTILNNTSFHGDIRNIIESIQNGTSKSVSDGSWVKEKGVGSAGWIIEGSTQGNQIRGQYETPGSESSQCSHRSEMWGVLGIIMSVNSFCDTYNITEGTITAQCDGEGTINILQWMHPITDNNRKHYDLILALKKAIDISPLTWTFAHLKGHQDKHTSFSQLDRWAQLNVLVDTLAKQEATRIINRGRQGDNIPVPYNTCRISFPNQSGTNEPISSHLCETLTRRIQTTQLCEYWKEKKKIGHNTSEKVDWEILAKSAGTYSRWKWLAKHVSGICGVGTMLQLWKYQAHNSCPRCGAEKEKAEHILLCSESNATNTWNDAVNDLGKWMSENDSDPSIIPIICDSLKAWRNRERLPYPTQDTAQIVIDAMVEQDSIGWYNMTNGFISKKWRIIQRAHLRDIGSMKSPELWTARLQRRIWEIAWKMWQHRNDFLHSDGRTIHFQESAAINQEIRNEYNSTGNGIPASYQYLFQGNIDHLLLQPIAARQEWLRNVWAARDHHSPMLVGPRNAMAEAFYLRWKKNFE